MDNVNYYKTIEECEKDIADKVIMLDVISACICNGLSSISRTIRTIFIWLISIFEIYALITKGPKIFFIAMAVQILISILWYILRKWIKFNYTESYAAIKTNLLNSLIDRCEEYKNGNYENWQRTQILKRFGRFANMDVKPNNNE